MHWVGRLGCGALAVAVLGGCGAPLGPCFSEAVEVALNGTLDGAPLSIGGQVSPSNTSSYPELKQFLIDGESLVGRRATLTLDGLDGTGYLAVELPASISEGQILTVDQIFVGGGWGVLPGSRAGVSVSARFGAVQATAGSGTVTVLASSPLRLRLDLMLEVGGAIRSLVGTTTFSFRRESAACT